MGCSGSKKQPAPAEAPPAADPFIDCGPFYTKDGTLAGKTATATSSSPSWSDSICVYASPVMDQCFEIRDAADDTVLNSLCMKLQPTAPPPGVVLFERDPHGRPALHAANGDGATDAHPVCTPALRPRLPRAPRAAPQAVTGARHGSRKRASGRGEGEVELRGYGAGRWTIWGTEGGQNGMDFRAG